jgi:2-(1,2-epoxy-1,2-dihydrophenyl)acetyl-CoA isomerase
MYQTILYSIQQGVATICLNRPEVYNAFNEQMSSELIDAVKKAGKDEEVRCIVLTGAGKAFCSGQDLKDAAGQGPRSLADSVMRRYNPLILGIRELAKPVICRVNGVAAGAGASLVFACDMVVATEAVVFVEAFINIGLVPDSGSSFFLPRTIGYHKAFELCALGNKFSAREAYELGLLNQLVPDTEALDQQVSMLAARFAAAPTKSVGLVKKMLNKAYTSDLASMLQYEAYCQEIAGRSADHKEGVQAFIEKRKPEFSGK